MAYCHAGDTETLPEGTAEPVNPNSFRIQEAGGASGAPQRTSRDGFQPAPLELQSAESGALEIGKPKGLRFTDKDEHMYFWFPLLAGLSELTFDPRSDIRCPAQACTASDSCALLAGGSSSLPVAAILQLSSISYSVWTAVC